LYDLTDIILTRRNGLLWQILLEDLPFKESDKHGWTPMHAAALYDEYMVAMWLKKRGCSMTSFDHDGKTPMHVAAAFANKQRTVNFLGANLIPPLLCVRTDDEYGTTPLHSAAVFGNIEAIKLLINAGVDPYIKDNHGFNAMHHAVFYQDQPKTIRRLAECGVPLNDAENTDGEHPLEIAIYWGFWGSAKALIDMGAYSRNVDQKWLRFINPPNAVGWSSALPPRRPARQIAKSRGTGVILPWH
jgi:ankyrin repeat protein